MFTTLIFHWCRKIIWNFNVAVLKFINLPLRVLNWQDVAAKTQSKKITIFIANFLTHMKQKILFKCKFPDEYVRMYVKKYLHYRTFAWLLNFLISKLSSTRRSLFFSPLSAEIAPSSGVLEPYMLEPSGVISLRCWSPS